jgi:tonB-dependent receptor plug
LDYWKNPGDNTRHPKINTTTFVNSSDARMIQDASFMRLKNITLSYSLPKEVIKQIKFFEGVRLYATARNIFTLTKYEGADPEYTNPISSGGYPPSRQFTLGVDVNF